VFCGLAEEYFDLSFGQYIQVVSADNQAGRGSNGIGWNSTTAMSGRRGQVGTETDTGGNNDRVRGNGLANFLQVPSLGINTVSALEIAPDTTGTTVTWFGTEDNMVLSAKWSG
jgi:hypothetical protein